MYLQFLKYEQQNVILKSLSENFWYFVQLCAVCWGKIAIHCIKEMPEDGALNGVKTLSRLGNTLIIFVSSCNPNVYCMWLILFQAHRHPERF